jgi:hypothetical protein
MKFDLKSRRNKGSSSLPPAKLSKKSHDIIIGKDQVLMATNYSNNAESLRPDSNESVKRHRNSFQKSFIRIEEKYECQGCQKLYFTRIETEICFDRHFDFEGWEKKELKDLKIDID